LHLDTFDFGSDIGYRKIFDSPLLKDFQGRVFATCLPLLCVYTSSSRCCSPPSRPSSISPPVSSANTISAPPHFIPLRGIWPLSYFFSGLTNHLGPPKLAYTLGKAIIPPWGEVVGGSVAHLCMHLPLYDLFRVREVKGWARQGEGGGFHFMEYTKSMFLFVLQTMLFVTGVPSGS